jgi:hypothetical protein
MSSMPMPVDRRQASASSVSTVSAAYRRWLLEVTRGTGSISLIRS